MERHIIEITETERERSYWECDCGISGSCPSYNVELAAEKHIPDNQGAVYRYRRER